MEQGARILVVDDDADMLKMLESILTLDGFRVEVCQNPESAIEMAERIHPDLIILDVMMPQKSGIEVMMDVRADPVTQTIPILFLSAVGEEAVVVNALKGADDYVIKPFKTLELEARINKILSRASEGAGTGTRKPHGLSRLPVERGDETFLVPLSEVVYFEASGKYSYAHTRNKKVLTGFSLGQLEERLPADSFLRVHRSTIVNVDAIRKVTRDKTRGTLVVLADENETSVKVSDTYLPSVREALGL